MIFISQHGKQDILAEPSTVHAYSSIQLGMHYVVEHSILFSCNESISTYWEMDQHDFQRNVTKTTKAPKIKTISPFKESFNCNFKKP